MQAVQGGTLLGAPFTLVEQWRNWLISCLGDAPQGPQEQPYHPNDPGWVQLGEERRAWGCLQQALNPGLQRLIQHACSLQCSRTILGQQLCCAVLCCAVLCCAVLCCAVLCCDVLFIVC